MTQGAKGGTREKVLGEVAEKARRLQEIIMQMELERKKKEEGGEKAKEAKAEKKAKEEAKRKAKEEAKRIRDYIKTQKMLDDYTN